MKKNGFVFWTILLFVLISMPLNVIGGEKVKKFVLKTQSLLPTKLPGLHIVADFAKQVELITDGSVKIKIFQPGALVPPMEIYEAVSKGQLEAGLTGPAFLAGKIPAAPLFTSYPFGPGINGHLAWYYYGNGMKLLEEMYDRYGLNVKSFLVLATPRESGGWFKKPIELVEDFNGLRARYLGIPTRVVAKLGTSVSVMPGGEIFSALEKGAIDATEMNCPPIERVLGFWKVAKYNYFPGWHASGTVMEVIINKDKWSQMSKAQQAAIETAAAASTMKVMLNFEAESGKAMRANAANGVHNLKFPEPVMQALEKAWLEVAAEESAKDEFFKKVWDDLNAFRKDYDLWKCNSTLAMPTAECQ